MGTAAIATVPVGERGLEGWTSCCDAAVTFSDETLCCKMCWHEVEMVALEGDEARELASIVTAVLMQEISADEGVARQRALLGVK